MNIYIRDYIGDYIVTLLNNDNIDKSGNCINDYLLGYSRYLEKKINYNNIESTTNITEISNKSGLLKYYDDHILDNTFQVDILDIPSYFIINISDRKRINGINEISFAKEFLEISENKSSNVIPKINSYTNKLPSFVTLSKTSNDYFINNCLINKRYPVYELNIASGKYNADSIVKYMRKSLENLKSRVYDYSKGIFYTETNSQKFIDLNNEYGINQESRFVISVNKSVNSITFKQYKKIFDSHKNTSVVNFNNK